MPMTVEEGGEGIHPVPGYVKDQKGVVWTIEQYESNRRRAIEAAGAYGGSNADFGMRFNTMLNEKLTNEILGNAINHMFSPPGGGQQNYGALGAAAIEFARGLGQGAGPILAYRINAVLEKFIPGPPQQLAPQLEPQLEPQHTPRQPTDINRQLIQMYDQGPPRNERRDMFPSPSFSVPNPFDRGNINASYEDFLMSLNPDDRADLEQYRQRKGYFGMPDEEVKKKLLDEQTAFRNASIKSGDTWTDENEQYKGTGTVSTVSTVSTVTPPRQTSTSQTLDNSPPLDTANPDSNANPLAKMMNLIESIHQDVQAQKHRLDRLEGVQSNDAPPVPMSGFTVLHDEIPENASSPPQELTGNTMSSSSSQPGSILAEAPFSHPQEDIPSEIKDLEEKEVKPPHGLPTNTTSTPADDTSISKVNKKKFNVKRAEKNLDKFTDIDNEPEQ